MNVSVQMTEKRMKKIQKNRRKTGADYEKAAGFYLEQMGYEILQFNYRCRLGEIDLIAKDGAYYVFCEVKYRADERKGSPLEAVDARKQQKIFRTAMYYLTEQQLEDALQKKPSFSLLLNAKQETSRLLNEDTEERQVRQMLIRRQRSDPQKPKHFQR